MRGLIMLRLIGRGSVKRGLSVRGFSALTARGSSARRPEAATVLLRAVCHELRPPLAILVSLTETLAERPAGDAADLARLAGEHAAHATAVLGQAAAAAYGLAGPGEQPQPLHRVLPSVLATVPADRLRLALSPRALAWPVQPRAVRQVLLNLLGNAVRHGPADRTVLVGADVRRRRLLLTVANHGPMPRDLVDALRRSTPPAGEQGLGLWVVRYLVGAAGGTVRVRPLAPDGIRVEVRLPAV